MILNEHGELVCPEGQFLCRYPMGSKCGTLEESKYAESLERIDWSKKILVEQEPLLKSEKHR